MEGREKRPEAKLHLLHCKKNIRVHPRIFRGDFSIFHISTKAVCIRSGSKGGAPPPQSEV